MEDLLMLFRTLELWVGASVGYICSLISFCRYSLSLSLALFLSRPNLTSRRVTRPTYASRILEETIGGHDPSYPTVWSRRTYTLTNYDTHKLSDANNEHLTLAFWQQ